MVGDSRQSCLGAGALERLAESIGPSNLPEVLTRILESAGATRDALRQQVARGDANRVAALAHSVKSECAYLGADELVRCLERLETAAREPGCAGAITGAPEAIDALGAFLDDVRRERDARVAGETA